MTADNTVPIVDDGCGDTRDDSTGRWEWVPTPLQPTLLSPKTQEHPSRTIRAGSPGEHSHGSDSHPSVHWLCAFGHPAVQSDVVRDAQHSAAVKTPPGVKGSSEGQGVDQSTPRPTAPRPDAVARSMRETKGPAHEVVSSIDEIQRSSAVPVATPASSGVTTRVVHATDRIIADPALLAAMLASISVSASVDSPHDSLPPTMSSQRSPLQSSTEASPSVEGLLYYHRDPVVPIPAGMVPLPPLPSSERPIEPETFFSSSQPARHYMSYVSTLPGLDFMPWNAWRSRIESHRGFPKPYRPDFRAPESREQAQKWWGDKLSDSSRRESPVRVLPPPPRPPVTIQGPHWWVVYVGRAPGIYSTADDVITQTRGFPDAQAEIFSDEDAARRWYWYARAQGFLVPRFGRSM